MGTTVSNAGAGASCSRGVCHGPALPKCTIEQAVVAVSPHAEKEALLFLEEVRSTLQLSAVSEDPRLGAPFVVENFEAINRFAGTSARETFRELATLARKQTEKGGEITCRHLSDLTCIVGAAGKDAPGTVRRLTLLINSLQRPLSTEDLFGFYHRMLEEVVKFPFEAKKN